MVAGCDNDFTPQLNGNVLVVTFSSEFFLYKFCFICSHTIIQLFVWVFFNQRLLYICIVVYVCIDKGGREGGRDVGRQSGRQAGRKQGGNYVIKYVVVVCYWF